LAGVLTLTLASQDVNQGEIESTSGRTVEFINYVGPHDRIDTIEQIEGIGESIGAAIASGSRSFGGGKYSVRRIVDASVKTGFDADLIIIGPDAEVDHIDNLRHILSGYFQAAYGMEARRSYTFAVFVTVYNAVYRSDTSYFASKYKPAVVAELPKESAGLSRRWDEWAGRSRIVIPLSTAGSSGTVTGIDTDTITDEKTIEGMRTQEDDRGVDERREMVDEKQDRIDEEKARIEEEKARIEEEERRLEEDKAKLAEDDTAGDDGTTDSGGDSGGTDGSSGDDGTADSGESDSGGDKGGSEDGTVTSNEIAEREKQLEEDKAKVAEEEKAVADKEKALDEERASIAEDTEKNIKEDIAAAKARTVILVQAVDPSYPYARLVALDVDTGKIVRYSDLNSIRARTLVDDGKQFIVIAGKESGGGAVRLVALDRTTLQQSDEGVDDIYPESWLWKNSAGLFAVVLRGGSAYLASFDAKLDVVSTSEVAVDGLTFLALNDLGLIVQRADGAFVILDPKTLKLIRAIGG
jgi:hypothetical protein